MSKAVVPPWPCDPSISAGVRTMGVVQRPCPEQLSGQTATATLFVLEGGREEVEGAEDVEEAEAAVRLPLRSRPSRFPLSAVPRSPS